MEDKELMAAIGQVVVTSPVLEYSVAVLVAMTDGHRDQDCEDHAHAMVRNTGRAMGELRKRACVQQRGQGMPLRQIARRLTIATALDRNELGALLVAAGLGSPAEHALISLLALNGLRVSEATGTDIEAMGIERGHRTLVITRKGGKVVTIPLAPRTARAVDPAIGERCEGPVFLAPDGRRLDRHGAGRIVRRVARRAGIGKPVGPHTLRHAFITAG